METDEALTKIFEANKNPLASENIWSLDNIAKIISDQNSKAKISDKQTAQILKVIESEDPRILNLSKLKISEKQLINIILDIVNNEITNNGDGELKQYQKILAEICDDPSKTLKQSLKFTLKSFESAAQNKPKSRTLQTKNFLVKKHVLDEPLIMKLFSSIGFKHVENNKTLVLQPEAADLLKKTNIVEDVRRSLAQFDTTKMNRKTKCKGNCGMFGDTKHDGYCSMCNLQRVSENASSPPKMTFCVQNCGFFGSEKTFGLCSSCFKQKKNAKNSKKTLEQKCRSALFRMGLLHWWSRLVRTDQQNRSRCWKCNKKIGLMAIRCECRYYYCAKHRSMLDHDCPVDYKKRFEKKLLKENPLIRSKKVDQV